MIHIYHNIEGKDCHGLFFEIFVFSTYFAKLPAVNAVNSHGQNAAPKIDTPSACCGVFAWIRIMIQVVIARFAQGNRCTLDIDDLYTRKYNIFAVTIICRLLFLIADVLNKLVANQSANEYILHTG